MEKYRNILRECECMRVVGNVRLHLGRGSKWRRPPCVRGVRAQEVGLQNGQGWPGSDMLR